MFKGKGRVWKNNICPAAWWVNYTNFFRAKKLRQLPSSPDWSGRMPFVILAFHPHAKGLGGKLPFYWRCMSMIKYE